MAKSPFLESVRTEIRTKQYSYRTEQSYLYWIRQFILFNDKKHPEVMGNHEIERFLNHLAVNRGVSPGTQNQALCAIIFVYKHVLRREIENLQYKMTKTPRRVPTVLNPDEVASILHRMEGEYWLITALLYGCGLRINEALSLRIKDIDLKSRNLLVFNVSVHSETSCHPTEFRSTVTSDFLIRGCSHEKTPHSGTVAGPG
ncbi:phage integrase N-terminal SAM-like domain-containing protein, partial [Marinobacter sp. G11]|uniref:phage integrase N-terminal SAM-like domain-containing protein n=1 Tax=Marinobacter sp. G11 TaxID=2903522 RepID=UPI001E2E117D|nr:phage integrase N-terminal SAM-like domain-containing protein [Marinobacter sp. G11]